MLKLLVLALALPLGARAAAPPPVTADVDVHQCYFHAGDNPAWASGDHSGPGWAPVSTFSSKGFTSLVVWMVCDTHLDLSGLADPAILLHMAGGYEHATIYANGIPLGSASGLTVNPDNLRRNTKALPAPVAADLRHIAIRIQLDRETWNIDLMLPLVRVGSGQALMDAEGLGRARSLLYGVLPPFSMFLLIFAAGLFLIAMYLYDRSQRAALWLGLYCLTAGYWRLATFAYYLPAANLDSLIEIVALPRILWDWFQVVFIFCVAGRRVPRPFWLVLAFYLWCILRDILCVTLPSPLAVELYARVCEPTYPLNDWVTGLSKLAPLVAFWPWSHLHGRRLALMLVSLAWVAADILWVNAGFFFHYHSWINPVANACGVATMAVVALFSGYLLSDYRRVTLERARLGSEMQSAREVQLQLVPRRLPATPGLRLEAEYLPAAEVGGDFYQVFEQPGHATLVVIGDVSGKGLKAAMTGSMVMGALRSLAQEDLAPAQILERLNAQVAAGSDGGFVTCLCARVDAEGRLTLANAGHLAPYRNGREVELEGGLPLGIVAAATYSETTVALAAGDRLTFLSDGVVEAQSAEGELFGFARTEAISTRPAAQIAETARAFGQSDDITVLEMVVEMALEPSAVAHA